MVESCSITPSMGLSWPSLSGTPPASTWARAVPLFQARLLNGPAPGALQAAVRRGARRQRFLLNVPLEDTATSSITVVLNWAAGLKK